MEYNLSADFVNKQNQILSTIAKKDIDGIAKKYLDVNEMNILLIGDKQLILPGLKRLGYEIVELDADGRRWGNFRINELANYGLSDLMNLN